MTQARVHGHRFKARWQKPQGMSPLDGWGMRDEWDFLLETMEWGLQVREVRFGRLGTPVLVMDLAQWLQWCATRKPEEILPIVEQLMAESCSRLLRVPDVVPLIQADGSWDSR